MNTLFKKLYNKVHKTKLHIHPEKAISQYKKELIKNPNSIELLGEYLLFCIESNQPINYQELINGLRKLSTTQNKNQELIDIILDAYNTKKEIIPEYYSIPKKHEAPLMEVLAEICKKNQNHTNARIALIDISLQSYQLPTVALQYFEKIQDTPVLITLYSHLNKTDKAAQLIQSSIKTMIEKYSVIITHDLFTDLFKKYPSNQNRIAEAFKKALPHINYGHKEYVFLGLTFMTLQDHLTAKGIYTELISNLEKEITPEKENYEEYKKVIERAKGYLHFTQAIEYLKNNKISEALQDFKTSDKLIDQSDLTDTQIPFDFDALYTPILSEIHGIKIFIRETEMFTQLKTILKSPSLQQIKESLNNIEKLYPLEESQKRTDFIQHPAMMATRIAAKALTDALNFKKVDYIQMQNKAGEFLTKGFLEHKKFIDQVTQFCFRLQKYSDIEDAKKDEQQLMQEFTQIKIAYQDLFQYLEGKFEQANKISKEGLGEIKQILEEPPKTQHYKTDHKIKITKFKDKDGLLEVFRAHQRFSIPTTKKQTDMLILMAKNSKERDKNKSDKDKGWTEYSDYKKGVPDWSESTKPIQIRNQISKIRKALKRNTINPFLIENEPPLGYRLSLPPQNISIET